MFNLHIVLSSYYNRYNHNYYNHNHHYYHHYYSHYHQYYIQQEPSLLWRWSQLLQGTPLYLAPSSARYLCPPAPDWSQTLWPPRVPGLA